MCSDHRDTTKLACVTPQEAQAPVSELGLGLGFGAPAVTVPPPAPSRWQAVGAAPASAKVWLGCVCAVSGWAGSSWACECAVLAEVRSSVQASCQQTMLCLLCCHGLHTPCLL